MLQGVAVVEAAYVSGEHTGVQAGIAQACQGKVVSGWLGRNHPAVGQLPYFQSLGQAGSLHSDGSTRYDW
jgi:hypothetical protein